MGAFLGWVWCFERIFIKSPSGRKRFNILGALNAITHEIITVTNVSCNFSLPNFTFKLRKGQINKVSFFLTQSNLGVTNLNQVVALTVPVN
jgi:hypothetical protein